MIGISRDEIAAVARKYGYPARVIEALSAQYSLPPEAAATMWRGMSAEMIEAAERFQDDTIPIDEAVAHQQESLEAQRRRRLRVIEIGEFLSLDLPKRDYIIEPIIPEQGLTMVYAGAGVGKTYVSLAIACAVATGGEFLRWRAPRPRKVLYVDGEMPAAAMQERLRALTQQSGEIAGPMFLLITPDLQEAGIPSLLTREGRALIEDHLVGVELVILDNLSSLIRGGKENDADSWGIMQEWLLMLRSRHISALLDHHAGRSGLPRGTSGREDVLDTTIHLDRPVDYREEEGARFVVRLKKARGIYGAGAAPMEVQLRIENGTAVWLVTDAAEDEMSRRIIELLRQGEGIRPTARLLGIDKGRVERVAQRMGGVS